MINRTFLDENKQLESGKWIPANLEYYKWYKIGAIVPEDDILDKIRIIFETLFVTYYSRRTLPYMINYSKEMLYFNKDMEPKRINEVLLNYDIVYETVPDCNRIKEEYEFQELSEIPNILKSIYGMEPGYVLVKFFGNMPIN